MKLEFGKKYIVTGIGNHDGFSAVKELMLGFVVTPPSQEQAKLLEIPDFTPPGISLFQEGYWGDFLVVSVPQDSIEFATEQEILPGDWITFVSVQLEKVN